MTKRTTKKAEEKKSEQGPSASGFAAKAPRSGDETHVDFGIHGLANILESVKKAKLEKEFNTAVGKEGTFVRVSRAGLKNIDDFIQSEPKLASLAKVTRECICDPNDPYCRYTLP